MRTDTPLWHVHIIGPDEYPTEYTALPRAAAAQAAQEFNRSVASLTLSLGRMHSKAVQSLARADAARIRSLTILTVK